MTENIFDQLSARIADPWVKGFLAGAVLALVVCIMAKKCFSFVGWIRSISVHRRVRKEQREDEERADAKKKTESAE